MFDEPGEDAITAAAAEVARQWPVIVAAGMAALFLFYAYRKR
jgi:hypothetical protein